MFWVFGTVRLTEMDGNGTGSMGRFDSESGRKAGQASRSRKLTLPRVATELGPLESHHDASRWLQQIAHWGMAGMVPGVVLNASVRAVEVWLRTKEAEASHQAVEALRQRLHDVTTERDSLAGELRRYTV